MRPLFREMDELRQPTTNVFIDHILTNLPVTRDLYLGCYSINNLPKVIWKRPSFLVCNTDPSWKGGQHWFALALTCTKDLRIYYFDSFGIYQSSHELDEFINKNGTVLCVTARMLQAPTSYVCGIYSMCFGILFSRGYSLTRIVSMFPNRKSKIENDDLIVNLFLELTGYCCSLVGKRVLGTGMCLQSCQNCQCFLKQKRKR